MSLPFNFDRLWEHVIAQFPLPGSMIHGPDHWRRVERNARLLTRAIGGDELVGRLFALFHDSRREDEGWDRDHGARGAALAAELRGSLFELSDQQFELLHFACVWHTDGDTHPDPTIGACWDADRLDLGRIHVRPLPQKMSTSLARQIAGQGSVEKRLRLLESETLRAAE